MNNTVFKKKAKVELALRLFCFYKDSKVEVIVYVKNLFRAGSTLIQVLLQNGFQPIVYISVK